MCQAELETFENLNGLLEKFIKDYQNTDFNFPLVNRGYCVLAMWYAKCGYISKAFHIAIMLYHFKSIETRTETLYLLFQLVMQVLGYSLQVVQTKALNSESKYSHAQSDIHVPELQKLFL